MMSALVIVLFLRKMGVPDANIELVPTIPGVTPKADPVGKHVIMADVTLGREAMDTWNARAQSFICLDHHISAQEKLGDLPYCKFDMDHSGCGMCWEHFFPGEEVPWFIAYAEDRDLWTWKLPDSKEINSFLVNLDFSIPAYEEMQALGAFENAKLIGTALYKAEQEQVKRSVKHKGMIRLGHKPWWAFWRKRPWLVPAVCSAHYQSEIGNVLALDAPFGVVWYLHYKDGEPMAQVSLRSCDRADVSKIATSFGGGGHKNAAGFMIPFKQWNKYLKEVPNDQG
jgi:hypothetical protein